MDGRHILGTTNCFRGMDDVEGDREAVSESSVPLLKSSDCCPPLNVNSLLCGNILTGSGLLAQNDSGLLGEVCVVVVNCSRAYQSIHTVTKSVANITTNLPISEGGLSF